MSRNDINNVVKRATFLRQQQEKYVRIPIIDLTSDDSDSDDEVYNHEDLVSKKREFHSDGGLDCLDNLPRPLKSQKTMQGMPGVIPSAPFNSDKALDDTPPPPPSTLHKVVTRSSGDRIFFCDAKAASKIRGGTIEAAELRMLYQLGNVLDEAISKICAAIPDLTSQLSDVCYGYDTANSSYYGSYNHCHNLIVINLFAYAIKARTMKDTQLLMHMITTVTHEVAHSREPANGHGAKWREAHMKLLVDIMAAERGTG